MKIEAKNVKIEPIEAKDLEELRLRIDNWRRCYEDRPISHISFLAKKIAEHEAAVMREAGIVVPGTASCKKFDRADAEILEKAWRSMDTHDPSRLRKLNQFGLTLTVAKTIVFIYAFAGNRYRNILHQYRRAILHVSERSFMLNNWETQSLRYFFEVVQKTEADQVAQKEKRV